MTEEQLYHEEFIANASEPARALYDAARSNPRVRRADELRAAAIASTDEALAIDHDAWFEAQQGARRRARGDRAGGDLRDEARRGGQGGGHAEDGARRRRCLGVRAPPCRSRSRWSSMRGISRSLEVLGEAAAHVRRTRDYTTRARKTADDEFGALTDAFSEMLAGIQARDEVLEGHRQNLEATVAERTSELEKRNREMRLVLDNVDQALVTLHRDGTMEPAHCARAPLRRTGARRALRRSHRRPRSAGQRVPQDGVGGGLRRLPPARGRPRPAPEHLAPRGPLPRARLQADPVGRGPVQAGR